MLHDNVKYARKVRRTFERAQLVPAPDPSVERASKRLSCTRRAKKPLVGAPLANCE